MDAKVKSMIKLIEEDADSFARRAEMYYKKRPELMKLVEEFYRAYRALAERYDYATGELRHAQRTLAAAFPNQVPFGLAEDSSSSITRTEPEDLHSHRKSGSSGLQQLHEMFLEGKMKKGEFHNIDEKDEIQVEQLSEENQNLEAKILSESERADKAECEIQNLKKALADMLAEKESLLIQYRQSLKKFSNADGELNCALEKSKRLDEKASKAEKEVHMLKETLRLLQAEKDAGLTKQKDYLEMISNLEENLSHAQEEAKGMDKRVVEAQREAQHLMSKLSRLESENGAGLVQYGKCLDRISILEKKIIVSEEEAKKFSEQAARAQVEVEKLRRALSELNEEKEALRVLYAECLEKTYKLELDLSSAQEDVQCLNTEVLMRTKKLQTTEEICVRLEMSNQSLKLEASDLTRKIMLKDQELCDKHEELEKLRICAKDEHTHYVQVEAALQTLQTLYTQSQEEQRALALQLKNGLQMLKDLEMCKSGLEEEMLQIKDDNRSLNELSESSAALTKNKEVEILGLRQMKERLEEEVALQMGQSTAMQQEILGLKEEIKELNTSYQALMSQLELVGLDPESLGSSVKDLQDENSRLRQICEKDADDEEGLSQKIENVKELFEKNTALASSLFNVNCELEGSRNKVEELQSSCQLLHGEKSALVLEKTLLLSQLHIITVNMQKLMDQSTVLENSLSSANVELECLREKSKGLEELCQLLNNEKSNLVAKRSILASQLESVQLRLETLENRFTQFEERYGGLEKEKEVEHSQLQELMVSLSMEKQERERFMMRNQTRLDDLENHIHRLHEESRWRKEEFQEELDKAVIAQFENFILQKFIKDVEEKNYSLLVEREKHIEASKLADKLISELETEILEQQVEEELLLVEVENLRFGIYQVFLALEIGSNGGSKDGYETAQISVEDIISNIKDLKCSLLKEEDDKRKLLVENKVILTLLQQLKLEVQESELHKTTLINEYEVLKDDFLKAEKEKLELSEVNRQLTVEVNKGESRANLLKSEVEGLHATHGELQSAYIELQEEYTQALDENGAMLKDISNLKEEHRMIQEENSGLVVEALALGNISNIFRSFTAEKAAELRLLSEDVRSLHRFNSDLEKELILLREKLDITQKENLLMKCTIEQLESKLKKTENMKSELGLAMEGMMRKCAESEVKIDTLEKETVELSNGSANLKKEIECLREVNGNLELELDMLHEEIEERKNIEENLASELQEKENEFELWDAEATSFYFDLQISNTRDILFENKVHELTGVCESLEGKTASKDLEIEDMKQKASIMESEIKGLRAQLLAYTPVIGSLKENMASLEHNFFSMANLICSDNKKSEDLEVAIHPHHHTSDLELMGSQNSLEPNGISDLVEFQTRIAALEKVIVEDINSVARRQSSDMDFKLISAKGETEELKSQCRSSEDQKRNKAEKLRGKRYLTLDNLNLTKAKPEISEARKGVPIRDIPLDQASDGSSSTNSRSKSRRGYLRTDDTMIEQLQIAQEGRKIHETDKSKRLPYEPQIEELDVDKLEVPGNAIVPNQEGNKRKLLQRLTSDAQKLANLEIIVKDLTKRLETSRKGKKGKGVDFDTVKEQLEEAEEAILQLVNVNVETTASIEKSPSLLAWMEQEDTWKGSERIKRVQLEMQKIQYVLLKLDDGKKSNGKSRFSRTKSRTSVILRDFIHHGRSSGRSSTKRRRQLCGCFTPSSTKGDHSSGCFTPSSTKGDRIRT